MKVVAFHVRKSEVREEGGRGEDKKKSLKAESWEWGMQILWEWEIRMDCEWQRKKWREMHRTRDSVDMACRVEKQGREEEKVRWQEKRTTKREKM